MTPNIAVKIIRSTQRKKTIQAKLVDGQLLIYLPTGLSTKEEEHWIHKMQEKMAKRQRRQQQNTQESLKKRAEELNQKYFNGTLTYTIEYTTNQHKRFGSCNKKTKNIRISNHVAEMPTWVRDYIIIHELAHLLYPDHSKQFWQIVHQYRYTERAKGYLIAIATHDHQKDKSL